MVSSGKAFSFPLPAEVVGAAADYKLRITQKNGTPLPTWLRYSSPNKTFSANAVPAGGLPIELLVSGGAQHWTLTITERSSR
jgi:hypothetical protein